MPSITKIRESNSTISTTHPELVAVFVGATSGIGEATVKQLAAAVPKPTIYLIGRNETAGSRLMQELTALNSSGSFHFIKSDVSLLRNVDVACAEIKKKEQAIDLLFMTTGYLATSRNDTTEGLEANHVLRYYARMRFIDNLLPLLSASKTPARVISVLAGGKEGPIADDNLELQKSFSFGSAAAYAASMNSLALECLASQHQSISFIHVYPGVVRTPLMSTSFGGILGSIAGVLTRPISISAKRSGECNLYIATSAAYPPAAAGSEAGEGVQVASASTGKVGGGSYVVNHDGSDATNKKLMDDWRKDDYPQKIWKHTEEVFERVVGAGNA